ncbi:MAG: cytochrome D1 domain-containing protein [Acidobacteriota bacterium]
MGIRLKRGLEMREILLFLLLALPVWAGDNQLLISQKGESSLAFYTIEGKYLTSVPVGKHPHEMVLSADGRYAYTTDNGTLRIEQAGEGGNTVSIVDLVARKKVGQISLGNYHRPHGIEIDSQRGHLLVTTENPDQLLIIDLGSRKVIKRFDTQGKTPHIVTLGRQGKWAYVSNARSASISAIHLSTGKTKVIPVGNRPEGSVLSTDGKELYVANRNSNFISVIDTERKERVADIATDRGAVRIDITPDGRTLLYALMESQKVGFADTQTRQQTGQVALQGRPVSLNLSPDGKYAFASAQEDDTVFVISVAERKVVRQVKTKRGAGPDPVLQISSY